MRKMILTFSLFTSFSIFAMPSPQYIVLDNLAQFGKYVDNNMTEIIESSIELAKKESPKAKCYFLVTKKTIINNFEAGAGAKLPFASFEMSCGNFTCVRHVSATVKTDQWGENRVLSFTLAPSIKCSGK